MRSLRKYIAEINRRNIAVPRNNVTICNIATHAANSTGLFFASVGKGEIFLIDNACDIIFYAKKACVHPFRGYKNEPGSLEILYKFFGDSLHYCVDTYKLVFTNGILQAEQYDIEM